MSGRRAAEPTPATRLDEHRAWMRKELALPYIRGNGRYRRNRSPFNIPAWPFNRSSDQKA